MFLSCAKQDNDLITQAVCTEMRLALYQLATPRTLHG